MKLYIDDCRIEKIKQLMDLYPVDGITSNPSVLKRCGLNPAQVLPEIRSLIGKDKMLMCQVISTDADDMIREAYRIMKLIGAEGNNYCVKVPAVPQGIKAIKALAADGIRIDATGIYCIAQALLAANAGAVAVAPYVSRVDNLGGDGLQLTAEIQELLDANCLNTGIVPGSIKTVRQVTELAKMGIEGVAISVDVWEQMLKNPSVDAAIDQFNSDFHDLMGEGKTFLDL